MIPGRFPAARGKLLSALIPAALLILVSASASGVLGATPMDTTSAAGGADKCIPCKAMQPIMREIAAEYKGQVQVIFYDVWKNPEPGRKYGIQLIPTQVFIDKTGKEIFRHVGLFPKEELVAFLKKQGVR